MKKLISLLLVLCMVLGMSVSVWALDETEFKTMKETLEAGTDYTLSSNINYVASKAAYCVADVTVKGATLDGNGNTWTVTNPSNGNDYSALAITAGTIKNLTVNDGFRAIVIADMTGDVTLDNVKVGGEGVCYALNTGANTTPSKLTVTNSELNGWSSFDQISSASFINCKFGQGSYYTNESGRLLKPYVTTTVEDCSFINGYYLDLSSLKEECKVTLKNCSVGGAALTADKCTASNDWKDYNASCAFFVELPGERTLKECVTFIYDKVEDTTTPDDNTGTVAPDTTIPEDTTTDDSWYEEEEEDNHTSSSDMDELIDETPKNATEVTIDDVNEDTTISKKAMEKAIEEGLNIEFKGEGYTLTLKTEDADFSGFKGTFNPYIDTDANCTTSMKSELKKNDIDHKDVQVIKTEFSGDLPGEMELSFTLNKELRGQKVYFYYWNPELKQYELIPHTVKGNKIIVSLSHFSTYIVTNEPIVGAIVEQGAAVTAPVVSVDKANPETGANDFVGAAVALAVVSSIGAVALNKRR